MPGPLSLRLRALAEMLRPGGVVADIGADHGQLICHLVGSGIAERGYACDIAEGPLAACARTVTSLGLGGKIELRLTDGLHGLPLGEIDGIIIAGMGGETIAEIIEAALANCQLSLVNCQLLLQPMTKVERLRAALYRMGCRIEVERSFRDGKRRYTIIQAAYIGQPVDTNEITQRGE